MKKALFILALGLLACTNPSLPPEPPPAQNTIKLQPSQNKVREAIKWVRENPVESALMGTLGPAALVGGSILAKKGVDALKDKANRKEEEALVLALLSNSDPLKIADLGDTTEKQNKNKVILIRAYERAIQEKAKTILDSKTREDFLLKHSLDYPEAIKYEEKGWKKLADFLFDIIGKPPANQAQLGKKIKALKKELEKSDDATKEIFKNLQVPDNTQPKAFELYKKGNLLGVEGITWKQQAEQFLNVLEGGVTTKQYNPPKGYDTLWGRFWFVLKHKNTGEYFCNVLNGLLQELRTNNKCSGSVDDCKIAYDLYPFIDDIDACTFKDLK